MSARFLPAHDGRLIALDAKTGEVVWKVLTTEPGDGRYISGPPPAYSIVG